MDPAADAADAVLVVDAANTVGSRPDGWWRDRAGAAERLLARLDRLVGAVVEAPGAAGGPGGLGGLGGGPLRVSAVHAVLEGRALDAQVPAESRVQVVLAPEDGDAAIAALAERLADGAPAHDTRLVVVTADRGLRARLPGVALAVGPGWLLDELDARDA